MSGVTGPVRLGIKDEVLAWEMDRAVTRRLLLFEQEQKEIDRKMLAYEVCRMAFGGEDVSKANLHPLLQGDPYADETTQVW